MAYRFVYPVNLEYTAESRFEAVNYKFVVDKIAELEETLDGKYALIDHTHDYSTTYAAIDHTHDYSDTYAAISHTHDYSDTYAAINHTHSGYALTDHNHDTAYSAIGHTHPGYALTDHTHDPFTLSTISSITGTNIVLSTEGNMFKKAITANTTFTFDVSGITFDQTKEEVLTFELLVVMGATVYTIAFPNTLTWLDTNPPTFATPSKSYLLAFRSYDNGQSWIGTAQGMF